MQKKENPPVQSMPLYQAINEFFVETFTELKHLDEIIVRDAETLQSDLNARLSTEYTIPEIEAKIEADCYLVPGRGFGFKRSDFFMPAKVMVVLLISALGSCAAGAYHFKKGDTVYSHRGLMPNRYFEIDKALPGNKYSAWDLSTNNYVSTIGGGSLNPIKHVTIKKN